MATWPYLRRSSAFVIGAIMAALTLAVLGFAWFEQRNLATLAAEGVQASARVIAKETSRSFKGGVAHRLRYEFLDAKGQRHERTDTVDRALWRRVARGASLDLRFLPDDPRQARLLAAIEREQRSLFAMRIGGAVFLAIGVGLVLWAQVAASRRAGLIAIGTVVAGEVIAIEEQKARRNQKPRWRMRFAFTDRYGQAHEGHSPYLPAKLEKRWRVGDKITVVHDQREPARAEADVFGLRVPLPSA